jgi:uncharacterized damage-inducible protein DinB
MRHHQCAARRAAIHAALALAVAALPAAPALAQQPAGGHAAHGDVAMPTSGLRAELIRDVEQLERKFLGLADAMVGKYDWRPSPGVRSVGEVLMHVAGANFMLPTMAGIAAPQEMGGSDMQAMMGKMREMEKVSDPAKVKEQLQHSFTHAKHAIARVPDDQLDQMTKMFGRDATKRAVLNLLVTHMHEHLGQSIAYARANGVTPPWSQGREGDE